MAPARRSSAGGGPAGSPADGPANGTTANRPTLDADDAGFIYSDANWLQSIEWVGTAWRPIAGRVGNVTIGDGATITHGLGITPSFVSLTGSLADENVTVTSVSSTTITVAIKKLDGGGAGTSQVVYWSAR